MSFDNVVFYWFVIGCYLRGKNWTSRKQIRDITRQCRNFWRVCHHASATNVSATSFPGSLSFDSLNVRRESPGTRLMFQVILDLLRRKNLRRVLASVHQKLQRSILITHWHGNLRGLIFFSDNDSEEMCHLRRRSHLLLDELERERQGNLQLRLEVLR